MKVKILCTRIVAAILLFSVSTDLSFANEAQSTAQMEQSSSTRSYRYVPTAGFAAFSAAGDDVKDGVDSTVGFTAGLLIDIGKGQLKFETGAQWLQTGFRYSIGGGWQVSPVQSYIGVPLLAKYYLNPPIESENDGFYFKGGVIPAQVISKETRLLYNNHIVSTGELKDANSTDVIAHLGAGFTSALFAYPASVDFGLYRGLVPLVSGAQIYNQGLTVSGTLSL